MGRNFPSFRRPEQLFADYATIDPESQGWKRRASRMLPLSEAIGAIAGFLNSSFQAPAALINRTFQRLFDYDEHCWPTLPQRSDASFSTRMG